MFQERFDQLGQVCWQPDVILVQKCDQIAMGVPDPGVARAGRATVDLRQEGDRIVACEARHDLRAFVVRAVIHHDDLIDRQALLQDAPQRLLDIAGAVVERDQDGGQQVGAGEPVAVRRTDQILQDLDIVPAAIGDVRLAGAQRPAHRFDDLVEETRDDQIPGVIDIAQHIVGVESQRAFSRRSCGCGSSAPRTTRWPSRCATARGADRNTGSGIRR